MYNHAQMLLDHAPDGLIQVGPDDKIIMASPVALRMLAYTADQVVGQHVNILLPEELRDRHAGFMQTFRKMMVSRHMGLNRDLRARRSDGSTIPIDAALVPSTDQPGVIYVWVRDMSVLAGLNASLRRDLEQERRARIELEHALERVTQELAANLPVAMGRVTSVVEQAMSVTHDMATFTKWLTEHDRGD